MVDTQEYMQREVVNRSRMATLKATAPIAIPLTFFNAGAVLLATSIYYWGFGEVNSQLLHKRVLQKENKLKNER